MNNGVGRMKLKTLKEIYCHDAIGIFEFRSNLRQEAIKWIKEKAGKKTWDGYSIEDIQGIRKWIEHFFNITEEETK